MLDRDLKVRPGSERAKYLEKHKLKGKDLVRWKYQAYMQDYLGCVAGVDENIGRILAELKRDAFGVIEGSRTAAVAGMMLFAILLSVCSEADAFVAASFVTLPAAAHLAYITIGPMVDIKLIGLYAATFRRRVFWLLILVPVPLVFVLSLVLGGLW